MVIWTKIFPASPTMPTPMKVKVCQAPVYLHTMGPGSIHIDVEHPFLDHVIEDGERATCQGKGHGIFISLDSSMLSRAEGVARTGLSHGQADGELVNDQVAGELYEIADALAFLGDEKRSIAYRRAARSIEQCKDDLSALVEGGNLKTLKWVGPSVSALVEELLSSGKTTFLERLRSRLPFSDLLRLENVDIRTGILLYRRLGVTTLRQLEELVDAGALWLDPQPMTLEDALTLEVHKRRAGLHAPILALLFEGLALVTPLRRRFTTTSICYDVMLGGVRRNLLQLAVTRNGIRVALRVGSLSSEVDRKRLLRSIQASLGEKPRMTEAGRVVLSISAKNPAWEFPRILRDALGG